MKAHRQYVKERIKRDPRFAQDLADARCLTQRDLARITGIKQPQIARIEKGQMPTLETLWRLAEALDAEVVIGPRQSVEIRAA